MRIIDFTITSLSSIGNKDYCDIDDIKCFLRFTNDSVPLYIAASQNRLKDDEVGIVPLEINNFIQRRQVSTILRDFMNINYSGSLASIVTNKGDKYYGGRSLILDKDFNVLYILCNNKDNTSTLYISPDVFNNDGIIHKAILKTIIPYVAAEGYVGYPRDKCNIVIDREMCNSFIVKPKEPKVGSCIDEEIRKLLIDNL